MGHRSEIDGRESAIFVERDDMVGVSSSRAGRWKKQFELTVDRVLGDRIRADGAYAIAMWSALANVEWHGPEDVSVSYSFRTAGDLVAWVREEGDYLDWYCAGPVAVVAPWIEEGLGQEGWFPHIVDRQR